MLRPEMRIDCDGGKPRSPGDRLSTRSRRLRIRSAVASLPPSTLQIRAGHVAREIRCQKMHAARHLDGLRQAAHGDRRRRAPRGSAPRSPPRRARMSSTMRVWISPGHTELTPDVVARMIQRHAARDLDDGALARAVGHVIRLAVQPPFRGDVHDRAACRRLACGAPRRGSDRTAHRRSPPWSRATAHRWCRGDRRCRECRRCSPARRGRPSRSRVARRADSQAPGGEQIRRGELRPAAPRPDGRRPRRRPRVASRPATMTLAPASANARAQASPMPVVEPVTSTAFPAKIHG